jgi:hypothetical protein
MDQYCSGAPNRFVHEVSWLYRLPTNIKFCRLKLEALALTFPFLCNNLYNTCTIFKVWQFLGCLVIKKFCHRKFLYILIFDVLHFSFHVKSCMWGSCIVGGNKCVLVSLNVHRQCKMVEFRNATKATIFGQITNHKVHYKFNWVFFQAIISLVNEFVKSYNNEELYEAPPTI